MDLSDEDIEQASGDIESLDSDVTMAVNGGVDEELAEELAEEQRNVRHGDHAVDCLLLLCIADIGIVDDLQQRFLILRPGLFLLQLGSRHLGDITGGKDRISTVNAN